ncbi:hypothetical protein GGS20DRAFT_565131 [Poronia punctata]|nr:hypothetical protein GGS20DRAFT_565131 [Poronia punctata]
MPSFELPTPTNNTPEANMRPRPIRRASWDQPKERYMGRAPPHPDMDDDRDVDNSDLESVEDGRSTVYEAWELTRLDEKHELQSFKTFCGIRYSRAYVTRGGGVMTKAAYEYEQGELADMLDSAVRLHTHPHRTYQQDLANRVSRLPTRLQEVLENMLDDRIGASNGSPYHKREWQVIFLQPKERHIAGSKPERSFSLLKKAPATKSIFVIFQGSVVKSTKDVDGWRGYDLDTNPWCKADAYATREQRRERNEYLKRKERAAREAPYLRRPLPHPDRMQSTD